MNSRSLMILASAGTVLLFVLMLHLCRIEAGRIEQARLGQAGREIERGARSYQLHCRTCHGIKGEGVGQLGSPLSDAHFFNARIAEVGWLGSRGHYVSAAIEQGRLMGTRPLYAGNGTSFVMPPWHNRYGGPLRSHEIAALTAFVLNWEATATGRIVLTELQLPEANFQDPQSISRGEAVFTAHCSGCHRYRDLGAAGGDGPELTALGAVAGSRKQGLDGREYIRESVLIPGAHIAAGYQDQAGAGPCGAVITETELTEIGSFLLQETAR